MSVLFFLFRERIGKGGVIMIDKNKIRAIKNFIVRQRFYVVLLLSLCLIGTASVISYKMSNTNKDNSISLDLENSDIQNAEKVENNSNASNQTDQAKETASTPKLNFVKPIEGTLLRAYTYPKPVKVDENNLRSIRGIDIKATVGTQVKAAEDGVVESAGNNGVEDGYTVVIAHVNGIKTKYTNLNANIPVKKGDKVKKNAVIGTVGNTAKIYTSEDFGEHLNLQVLDSKNEQIDPSKYFSYQQGK